MLINIDVLILFLVNEFQKMRSFAMVCEDFAQKKESRMANFTSEWYKKTGNNSNGMNAKKSALLGDK